MQAMDEYHWAQDKIDEVVTGKEHREQAACERRLRQMQARRDKAVAKVVKKTGAGDTARVVFEPVSVEEYNAVHNAQGNPPASTGNDKETKHDD